MTNDYVVGTELRYCHEGNDLRAIVTEVDATGAVSGIAVYEKSGSGATAEWRITHGVTGPQPATTPQHRITHGFFWRA